MQKIQKYNEINIEKIICADAEKKEFKDKEDKQVSYHSIPIFYDRGDMTTDCLVRLPICRFFPLDEKSHSLVIVHDKNDANFQPLSDFFDKLKGRCAEFLSKHANKIGKRSLKNVEKASDALGDPIYVKVTEDGKAKGSGNTYLKLIPPSPTRNCSLFVGPNRKVYPKKKLFGYSLKGSPVIKVENIYCGQSCSIRFKLIQLDISEIKKLNSASIDPDYAVEDPKVVSDFLAELKDEEEEPKVVNIDKVKEYLRKGKEEVDEDSDEEEVTMPS